MKSRSLLTICFIVVLLMGFFILISQARADQTGSDAAQEMKAEENSDVEQPTGRTAADTADTGVQEAAGNEKSSPFKEMRVTVNDRLKAFLSFGAPAIRDLSGKQIGQNYRALFGFHVSF